MGHGRGREKTKPIGRSDEAGRGGGQDTGRSQPGRPRYWDPKRDESRLGTHSWALAPMLRNTLRRHYGQDFCAKQTQFGQEPFQRQVLCDKDLPCLGRGESPHKTKPISRSGAPRRCPDCGLCETNPIRLVRRGRRERNVRNKPNFPARPGGASPDGHGPRGKCAKQTQFAGNCHRRQSQFRQGLVVQTNPIPAGMPPGRRDRPVR